MIHRLPHIEALETLCGAVKKIAHYIGALKEGEKK